MALIVRRTKTPGKCTCYEFPRNEGIRAEKLCFRSNFVGALSDEQVEKYCDMGKSEIYSPATTEVQNLVRTIKKFSAGVQTAGNRYYDKDDFKKDMDVWREEVSKAVRETPPELEYPDWWDPIQLAPIRCKIKPKPYVQTDISKLEGWF